MTSRRAELVAVASVVSSAGLAVALGAAEVSHAHLAREPWSSKLLVLLMAAGLTTAPLPKGDRDAVDRWFGGGLYVLFNLFRVLGVCVAFTRATEEEFRFQLTFASLFQALLFVTGNLGVGGFALALLGFFAFALVAGTLEKVAPGAVLPLGWAVLTLARYVQVERWLRREAPETGRWRHPGPRLLAWPLEAIANSRTLRVVLGLLPKRERVSDTGEVLVAAYLVDDERFARLVEGTELQRFGRDGRYGLLTVMTYGRSGRCETVWRAHVIDGRTRLRGVRVLTSAADGTASAMAARLLSDAGPMHVLRDATLSREADGTVRWALDPGRGSGPDASATLRPVGGTSGVYREGASWTGPWSECFADARGFIEYCLSQDRVIDGGPWTGRVLRQGVYPGVAAERCTVLEGEVASATALAIADDARPLCFVVPGSRVRSRAERE